MTDEDKALVERVAMLPDGNAWPSTVELLCDLRDRIEAQAAEIARKDEALRAALEELWAPEAGCSCHVIPPCRDCVEYGSIRETQSVIRAALGETK